MKDRSTTGTPLVKAGSILASLIPDGYDIRKVGNALLHRGGWRIGGECIKGRVMFDGKKDCLDYVIFSFGPRGRASGVFTLSVETSPEGELLCLYVSLKWLDQEDDRRGLRACSRGIVKVFNEMHRMRSGGGLLTATTEVIERMVDLDAGVNP